MWKLLILSLLFVVAAVGQLHVARKDEYIVFPRTQWAHKLVKVEKTWEDAQKHCQAEGASLTGFDSYAEVEHVYNTLLKHENTSAGFYVGGKRRDECTESGFNPNPLDKCGRPNVFQWVNKVASNPITDNMWTVAIGGALNPNHASSNQNCLIVRAVTPDWMDISKGGYLDDIACVYKLWFICGKKPSS